MREVEKPAAKCDFVESQDLTGPYKIQPPRRTLPNVHL